MANLLLSRQPQFLQSKPRFNFQTSTEPNSLRVIKRLCVEYSCKRYRQWCAMSSPQDLDEFEDENEQLKQENKTLLKVVGQLTM